MGTRGNFNIAPPMTFCGGVGLNLPAVKGSPIIRSIFIVIVCFVVGNFPCRRDKNAARKYHRTTPSGGKAGREPLLRD